MYNICKTIHRFSTQTDAVCQKAQRFLSRTEMNSQHGIINHEIKSKLNHSYSLGSSKFGSLCFQAATCRCSDHSGLNMCCVFQHAGPKLCVRVNDEPSRSPSRSVQITVSGLGLSMDARGPSFRSRGCQQFLLSSRSRFLHTKTLGFPRASEQTEWEPAGATAGCRHCKAGDA